MITSAIFGENKKPARVNNPAGCDIYSFGVLFLFQPGHHIMVCKRALS
jgi:hypothetical protein